MVEAINPYEVRCAQVEAEFVPFLELLKQEKVTRLLEVGSRFGGSLWRIANVLPTGSRVVSCDSGKGMGGRKPGAVNSLRACVLRLKRMGYDIHLIMGHSQSPHVVKAVSELGPFDAVFLDGDHEYEGVKKDWENFGPVSRIVAFHDIAWVKPSGYTNSKEVQVPRLWNELKKEYRHQEFVDYSTGATMGIGVLWRC